MDLKGSKKFMIIGYFMCGCALATMT